MRPRILLGVLCFACLATHGQKLTMYRTFGGAHFEYEKDTSVFQVSPRQVGQILFDDPEAYAEFKKARSNNAVAGILGFVGAGLLIIPTVTAIAGGEPEWGLAAGGAALIIGSIPLQRNARRHAQNAVDLHNKKHASTLPRTTYYVSATGVRMVIRF